MLRLDVTEERPYALAFGDADWAFAGGVCMCPFLNLGEANLVFDARRFNRDDEFCRGEGLWHQIVMPEVGNGKGDRFVK
ncbi:MAG: hypothetical protein WBM04_00885 [Candidatus Korobacteraceae bacterium]